MHVHTRLMMSNDDVKIDDVKPIILSSCVCTRCVHDSLLMHTCMSGMHMPNLDCIHFGVHANCKPMY